MGGREAYCPEAALSGFLGSLLQSATNDQFSGDGVCRSSTTVYPEGSANTLVSGSDRERMARVIACVPSESFLVTARLVLRSVEYQNSRDQVIILSLPITPGSIKLFSRVPITGRSLID